MEGTVAAGELTFRLAGPADDAGIRELLRQTPMAGEMQLSFEREPSAFAADAVEGDFHQTIVAKDRHGRIVGMGGRSIHDAYINGQPARLGYLGQLRIAPSHRGREMLMRGYAFLRELHGDGQVPFYLTSILTDNLPARRLLEANLRGMPTYQPLEEWLTFAIPTRQGGNISAANSATAADALEIVECLRRNGSKTQYTPVWRLEDFIGSPRTCGLEWDDFLVMREGDSIKACGAVWDQRAFKQVIVRGYSGRLRRWKWLINCFAPLAGWPVLPAAVAPPLSQAYLSHLAVPREATTSFGAIVNAALRRAAYKGCEYLLIGMAARDPLVEFLRKNWKHRSIASMLYLVHWEDAGPAIAALDQRLPYVEIATL